MTRQQKRFQQRKRDKIKKSPYPNVQDGIDKVLECYKKFIDSNYRHMIVNLGSYTQVGKTDTIVGAVEQSYNENYSKNGKLPEALVTTLYGLKQITGQISRDFEEVLNGHFVKLHTLHKKVKKNENILTIEGEECNIVIFDECEYGIDCKNLPTQFKVVLDSILNDSNNSCFIICVGATNYSLANASTKMKVPVENIFIEPGEDYFGVPTLLENGKNGLYHIELPEEIEFKNGNLPNRLRDELIEVRDDKSGYRNCVVIRDKGRNNKNAKLLQTNIDSEVGGFKTYIVSEEAATGSGYTLSEIANQYLKMGRKGHKVCIIVIGIFSAGYRISPNYKECVGLVVETSKPSASVVQGLVGRMTGYDFETEGLKIMCKWDHIVQMEKYVEDNFRNPVNLFLPFVSKASTSMSGKGKKECYVDVELVEKIFLGKEHRHLLSNRKGHHLTSAVSKIKTNTANQFNFHRDEIKLTARMDIRKFDWQTFTKGELPQQYISTQGTWAAHTKITDYNSTKLFGFIPDEETMYLYRHTDGGKVKFRESADNVCNTSAFAQ